MICSHIEYGWKFACNTDDRIMDDIHPSIFRAECVWVRAVESLGLQRKPGYGVLGFRV